MAYLEAIGVSVTSSNFGRLSNGMGKLSKLSYIF